MATITTSVIANTAATLSTTTLDGSSDTFTFSAGKTAILILSNETGGSLSPVITGSTATTATCDGIGSIDLTGGTDIFGAIADGTKVALRVGVVSQYLQGTITITGGTGLTAEYLELGA